MLEILHRSGVKFKFKILDSPSWGDKLKALLEPLEHHDNVVPRGLEGLSFGKMRKIENSF